MRSVVGLGLVLTPLAALIFAPATGLSQGKGAFEFVKRKAKMVRQPVYYVEYYRRGVRYYIPIILGMEHDAPTKQWTKKVAIQLDSALLAADVEQGGKQPLWVGHFLGEGHSPLVMNIQEFRKIVPGQEINPNLPGLAAGYRLPHVGE